MLGAIIMVTEPPIGRLTIIALVGGMGGPDIAIPYFAANQWIIPMVEMGLQMLIVAVIMLRDRAIRGSVHKVLWYVLAGVPLLYAAIWGLAAVPAFADFVFSLKGSAL
nr:hypothetical protein [Desulfuromonadales bacterium]